MDTMKEAYELPQTQNFPDRVWNRRRKKINNGLPSSFVTFFLQWKAFNSHLCQAAKAFETPPHFQMSDFLVFVAS
eukprot:386789-Amphidinium_carterae.1